MVHFYRAFHGSEFFSRAGSGRVGTGQGDPARPVTFENLPTRPVTFENLLAESVTFENFLTRPDPTRTVRFRTPPDLDPRLFFNTAKRDPRAGA